MKTVDEWWYAFAELAATMDGRCLDDLAARDGHWPSDEARQLFSAYIDRGVAAYDVLAPVSRAMHGHEWDRLSHSDSGKDISFHPQSKFH